MSVQFIDLLNGQCSLDVYTITMLVIRDFINLF